MNMVLEKSSSSWKISICLLKNKTVSIVVWASGNIMVSRLKGQWFLPQGCIFFQGQEIAW